MKVNWLISLTVVVTLYSSALWLIPINKVRAVDPRAAAMCEGYGGLARVENVWAGPDGTTAIEAVCEQNNVHVSGVFTGNDHD